MVELDLTDTQAAYIAGLIDGEGWVGICTMSPNLKNGNVSTTFVPRVQVEMTNEKTIEWLHKTVGFGFITRIRERKDRKPAWKYVIANRQASKLLQRILPFMITKREQAELLIEIAILRANTPRGYGRRGILNPDRQVAITNRIKYLNKRGVCHAPSA